MEEETCDSLTPSQGYASASGREEGEEGPCLSGLTQEERRVALHCRPRCKGRREQARNRCTAY